MSNWHYNDTGVQRGPITAEELKAKIAAGDLSGSSLVWQVGTTDWKEVRNCPALVEQIQSPPPLPKSVTVVAGTKPSVERRRLTRRRQICSGHRKRGRHQIHAVTGSIR